MQFQPSINVHLANGHPLRHVPGPPHKHDIDHPAIFESIMPRVKDFLVVLRTGGVLRRQAIPEALDIVLSDFILSASREENDLMAMVPLMLF